MSRYRISQLAERTRVPATTLRFYEKLGLVPAARSEGGYRIYTDTDADRVRFISAAKLLGLPLDQIRDLLGVWDGGMCREIRDELQPMVAAQVTAAGERMEELRTFRDRLTGALAHLRNLPARNGPCDPACAFLHDLPGRAALPRRTPPEPPPPASAGAPGASTSGIACSLDTDGYAERIADWRRVLGDADREPFQGGGLKVRLPAVRAGRLVELVLAEQRCCPFLEFQMVFDGAHVELIARAPDGVEPLVAALFETEPGGAGGDPC